jgi:predicted hydrocarbon binding protein
MRRWRVADSMSDANQDTSSRIRLDTATGTLSDGAIRYVMIRADGLMGAFVGSAAHAGLAALCESVYQHGRNSLIHYQREHGRDPAALMATVARVAAQLGWGAWEVTRPSHGEVKAIVRHSPFAEAAAPSEVPSCAPILGMVRAVGELVLGTEVRTCEQQCVACGASRCEFSAKSVG